MRKLLLVAAVAAALPATVSAKPFLAKQVGQGFTGVTGDFTQAQYNPALLAKFDDDDDLFFTFGGGLIGSDQDELLDEIEQTQELLDSIEEKINNQAYASQTEADADAAALKSSLAALDGKSLIVDEGLNLMLAIPMQWASLGLLVNQELRLAAGFRYSSDDAAIIDAGMAAQSFDADSLSSGGAAIGINLLEGGLIIAKSWQGQGVTVEYGTTLKYQRLDLFSYSSSINAFDDDDFDGDEYLVDDSQFNVDLGLQLSWGEQRQWQLGIVAKDLLGFELSNDLANDIDGKTLTYRYELDPSATLGIAYDNNWFRFAVDADLMPHSELGLVEPGAGTTGTSYYDDGTIQLGEVQYAGVALELDAWEWVQLRLGYRSDLKSNVADVMTAGIGLSPFDVLSLDLSAVAGDDDTYGAALQLGLKF